ncbi:MAG: mechanosensitive ion channel protein MscS [Planctomycetaceae bacterium]|nr:mechanosensitive ion channel protein MscS [Planctomycetaceae bacterium]
MAADDNDAQGILDQDAISTVWHSVLELWESFLERLPFLVSGAIALAVTWGVARLVGRAVGRFLVHRRMRRSLRDLIVQLLVAAIWVVGLTVAMVIVFPNMTPTKVLAGLGLSSIAIGFAFKDIVENFLAGILILWRFPFEFGDFIACGDITGKVEQITVRNTMVRQTDGQLVVLPNAQLFKQPVIVMTSLPRRRVTIVCGVAYGEDVGDARGVIADAVRACETVDRQQVVEIFAQEFASSSINFEVSWWCGPTPLEVRQSRDEVVEAVKRALDGAGIEIPFPYRTLTFKEPLAVQRPDAAGEPD